MHSYMGYSAKRMQVYVSLSLCVRVCALGSCLCVHTSSDSVSLSGARTYGVKVDGGQGELP
jgi:hypothetical protein